MPNGGTVTTVPPAVPRGPRPEAVEKFHQGQANALAMVDALEDHLNEARRATKGDRAQAISGVSNALSQSYGLAAMLTKGEELLNLGVITGPDLQIIRSILPDPTTFKGTMGDYENAIQKVTTLIKYKQAVREAQLYGKPLPKSPALIARELQQSEAAKGYVAPGGRPVSMEDIEATAKMHKITVDQVIRDLKLKKAD